MAKYTTNQKKNFYRNMILLGLTASFPALFLYIILGNNMGISATILLSTAIISYFLGIIIFFISKIENHLSQLVKDTVRLDD